MINLFIVDDHQIFRDGLKLLFENTEDMAVAGEAESGKAVLAQLADVTPDLILMDIQMPGLNGIETTRRIKAMQPEANILMLTMFEDDQSVFAAMRAGALGYVLKGANHGEMLQAVRVASAGGAVFSPRVAAHIIQWFAQPDKQPAEETAVQLPALTTRELEVLELLAVGLDNSVIAERLTVTNKTVRNYVSQLLKKLEVNDRLEAAEVAHQAGIK
ncbi:MAG: response regulator transcription factor [Anaerolineaceae bacterium]|nr:response regulator transcription factor [Anaerolineaceae bacterium]